MVPRHGTSRFGSPHAERNPCFYIIPRSLSIRIHVRSGKNAHKKHAGLWIGCTRGICPLACCGAFDR